VLLPQNLPDLALPRSELVEALLREEFGRQISKQLISLPSLVIAKEKSKHVRREKRTLAVTEAHETREECVRSWPQVVLRNIVCESLNTYYEGSRWSTPPVCCVCSRQQYDVEIHDVVLKSDDELPDHLSTLRNGDESLFPDDEFQFADPRLNGLVLDPRGLQIRPEHTTLQICHPCNGYLPRGDASVCPCEQTLSWLFTERVSRPNMGGGTCVCDILQHSCCHSDLPVFRPVAACSLPRKYLCPRDECGLNSSCAPPHAF